MGTRRAARTRCLPRFRSATVAAGQSAGNRPQHAPARRAAARSAARGFAARGYRHGPELRSARDAWCTVTPGGHRGRRNARSASACEFRLLARARRSREWKLAAGGEGGIRTLERLAPLLAFQASAFNRSTTSPKRNAVGERLPNSSNVQMEEAGTREP